MSSKIVSLAKFNVSFAAGICMTFALLYLMQALVVSDQGEIQQIPRMKIADISIPAPDVELIKETPRVEKPEPPQELPPFDIADAVLEPGDWTGPPLVPGPVITPEDGLQGLLLADGNAVPLVRVPPQYPTRALQRGIEGEVLLEFDVSENGSVMEPRVLASEPPGMFDRAALQAVVRWKYNPRMVDGKPVKMFGLKHLLTFELEE